MTPQNQNIAFPEAKELSDIFHVIQPFKKNVCYLDDTISEDRQLQLSQYCSSSGNTDLAVIARPKVIDWILKNIQASKDHLHFSIMQRHDGMALVSIVQAKAIRSYPIARIPTTKLPGWVKCSSKKKMFD